MRTFLQSTKQIPAWQRERDGILQRACRSLKGRRERGECLERAGKIVARRYDGLAFKCDPERKLRLNHKTLRHLFREWTHNGESSDVFRLNYIHGRQSVFTSPILTRFLQFIIDRPQPSLASAWKKFSQRGGNWGPGRRAGKPLTPTYYQIRWALPTSLFYQILAEQKAIAAAQARIEKIQAVADAALRAKYPEHPPRKRMRRSPDFQI
ncbi:MAG TPA: hypothetical protein VH280_17815 [Verrucomicrobiae bacterium]|jgi:hypothetical protein|nr:hypothetical protein [Verrucomicrobiae bacterium]